MRQELEYQELELKINRQADELREEMQNIAATSPLGAVAATGDDTTGPDVQVPAINYLDNSDLNYSKKAAFDETPQSNDALLLENFIDTDENQECFNFFRQRATKSGNTWNFEQTEESAARAVKYQNHSLFAATEGNNPQVPRWDRTNGWIEFGTPGTDKFDIATPLPINLVNLHLPQVWIRFIVAKKTVTGNISPLKFYAGIYDSSADQHKLIEGGLFTANAGIPPVSGSRTLVYKLIATDGKGSIIESNEITVSNAPNALSAASYVELSWGQLTGLLNIEIYRFDGSRYARVFTVLNGSVSFRDTGSDDGENITAFPSGYSRKSAAYAESELLEVGNSWVSVRIPVPIPAAYNAAPTTAKQFLRVGIIGDTESDRDILIDRFSLSFQDGGWNLSARDLNRTQTQIPTAVPSAPGPVVEDIYIPYQGDAGIYSTDYRCFTPDTPLTVTDADASNPRQIPIGEAETGMYALGGSHYSRRITGVKRGTVSEIIAVVMSNGIGFKCSATERFITSRADKRGTLITELTFGDVILTNIDGRIAQATIEKYEVIRGEFEVVTLSLAKGHIFLAGFLPEGAGIGGALAHNLKDVRYLDYGLSTIQY